MSLLVVFRRGQQQSQQMQAVFVIWLEFECSLKGFDGHINLKCDIHSKRDKKEERELKRKLLVFESHSNVPNDKVKGNRLDPTMSLLKLRKKVFKKNPHSNI
jgi:hypothetical protein